MYHDSRGIDYNNMPRGLVRGSPYKLEVSKMGRDINIVDGIAWIWKVPEGRGADKHTLVAAIIKSAVRHIKHNLSRKYIYIYIYISKPTRNRQKHDVFIYRVH